MAANEMTTGELIKILADYCPDTPVVVSSPEHTGIGENFLSIGAWEYDDTEGHLDLQTVEDN